MPDVINMRIPADMHAAIKGAAEANGRTWIGQLRALLDEVNGKPVSLADAMVDGFQNEQKAQRSAVRKRRAGSSGGGSSVPPLPERSEDAAEMKSIAERNSRARRPADSEGPCVHPIGRRIGGSCAVCGKTIGGK